MKHTKITKLVVTGLASLTMGGALIAPQVLPQQNVNASQLRRRHRARRHGLHWIHGRRYYFVRGRKLKGFRTIRVHGHRYRVYFSKRSGAMLTGFRRIHGHTYYFSKRTGNMLRGRHRIGNRIYIFIHSGRLVRSYTVNLTTNNFIVNNPATLAKNTTPRKPTTSNNNQSKQANNNNQPAQNNDNNNTAQDQNDNNNDAKQNQTNDNAGQNQLDDNDTTPQDDSNFIGTPEAIADFQEIQSKTANGVDSLPSTFHGMPLPDFSDFEDIVKNGYVYSRDQYDQDDNGDYAVGKQNKGRLIFPVSEDNGIVTFSNGVRADEDYAGNSAVTQDTLKHDMPGMVYTLDDLN